MILLNTYLDYGIYAFTHQDTPEASFCFEEYLFNSDIHLFQQNNVLPVRFYLISHKQNSINAKLSFFLENNVASSPYRAPFGGLQCNSMTPPELFIAFLENIHTYLHRQGILSISIKMYPESYHTEASSLARYVFSQLGYQIESSELNFHIHITPQPFAERVHLSKKRILKKCQKEGFIFKQIFKPQAAHLYDFIYQARLRREHPISLSKTVFEQLVERFSENFLFFNVANAQEISAAWGVVIRVNSQILYHFYPADSADFTQYSPTVMLNEGIYQYAQSHGYSILDLGIATEHGKLNPGLARFKQEIAGEKSLKLIFQKTLTL